MYRHDAPLGQENFAAVNVVVVVSEIEYELLFWKWRQRSIDFFGEWIMGNMESVNAPLSVLVCRSTRSSKITQTNVKKERCEPMISAQARRKKAPALRAPENWAPFIEFDTAQ